MRDAELEAGGVEGLGRGMAEGLWLLWVKREPLQRFEQRNGVA